jgi:DNA-binding response OmpR family regulator
MPFDQQTILIVEDNEDDVFILKRVLTKAAIRNPIQIASDGQQATDYLAGAGPFQDRERFPLPFLVLLDLKLPYKHGFEVLQSIRSHSLFDALSVIVLTSSAEERDVIKAYELGARSFFVKPPTVPVMQEMMTVLRESFETGNRRGPIFIAGAQLPPGMSPRLRAPAAAVL